MKAPRDPERTPAKAKPKAKAKSRSSKARKSATWSESPPKSGAKTKAAASRAKPTKARKDEQVAVAQKPASELIDQRIRGLGGWRGETLARMRTLILQADPGMSEEWKWDNPVWSHQGIVCTGEAYTKVVKLTFAHGAKISDPSRLFNSSLGGNTRRAIDIHEGEKIDVRAFQALVKAAVAQNGQPAKKR
jgi:hypothetical protein